MKIQNNFFQDLYFQWKQKKPESEQREDVEMREKTAGEGVVQESPYRGDCFG